MCNTNENLFRRSLYGVAVIGLIGAALIGSITCASQTNSASVNGNINKPYIVQPLNPKLSLLDLHSKNYFNPTK